PGHGLPETGVRLVGAGSQDGSGAGRETSSSETCEMNYKALVCVGALLPILGCASSSDTGRSGPGVAAGGTANGGAGGALPSNGSGGVILDVDAPNEPDDDKDCNPKIIGLLRDFQSPRSSKTTIDDSALETCPVYGD